MKLIFVAGLPTSKIFGQKLDPWWYEEHGFDVEFWDLSSIYCTQDQIGAYYSGATGYRFIGPNHRVFENKRAVFAAICKLSVDAWVWNLSWNRGPTVDDFWMLRQLAIRHIRYFTKQFENVLPVQEAKPVQMATSLFRKVIDKSFFRKSIVTRIKRQLFMRTNYYGKPELFVGVGNMGRMDHRNYYHPDTTFLSIPSPSIYWAGDCPSATEGNYCLFIDESIGHEPDAKMLGYCSSRDLESYYRNLDYAFSVVERATGWRVVVGASGKVEYSDNPFNGRQIIYRKTNELTCHAEIVLGHSSGGLYQAICVGKPILILLDQSFIDEKKNDTIRMGRMIGVTPIDAKQLCVEEVLASREKRDQCAEIVADYFCEPGVEGDYRELIANALTSLPCSDARSGK